MSASDRIPLEGVLNCWNDDHDLPDLLLFVCRTKKTGQLAFSSPEGDKTLHVRGGRIVFAESSSGDDGLGHYLLRTGKISLMDYLRVSKLVEPGKRLGALLVAEGVMEPKDLAPAVLGQVRAIILGLFRRTETWYRFKEGALSSETITLDLPVESLILDGVRQVESWRRISKGVGHLESRYRAIEGKQEEWEGASFPPVVEELFEMLSSPVSVAEICTNATLPDFEACRYLWAFRCLGWIEPLESQSRTADAADEAAASAEAPAPREVPTQKPPEEKQDAPPRPKPDSKFRRPTLIPQQLIETKVAFDPPKMKAPETSASGSGTGNTQRISPAPVIPELDQTDVAEPPSATQASPNDASVEEAALPKPPPIPDELAHTNLAVEPPSATPDEPAPAKPKPPSIPDELAHTNLAVAPPRSAPLQPPERDGEPTPEKEPSPPPTASPSEPPPPPPIPDEIAHTNLAVEPPPAATAEPAPETTEESAASEPVPAAEDAPPSMADIATPGPAHTQMFIEPPAALGPPSTGEMMESILSAQSSPDVNAKSSMAPETPGAAEAEAEAEAEEADADADADTADAAEVPAGFEALAFDESDPSISSIQDLSMTDPPTSEPAPPDAARPTPPPLPVPDSEVPSAAAPALPPELSDLTDVDSMASFQDLAYDPGPDPDPDPDPAPELAPQPQPEPEPEAEPVEAEATVVSAPPLPVFEAEPDAPAPAPIPTPSTAPPASTGGDPPIVAPPPPPRRKRSPDDAYDLDDGLPHYLTSND